ncbi:MAG: phosphatidylserine/phosphatidylglycerophosphate/cardiolipin synthase family protein [Novosphingobium sp.]|nr:phosphatidylserine/phosphatidylglycerophosphate/cardiolipin synthase family protein [Novosphingobium sp.]
MSGIELLVGSRAFWDRAARDIAAARHRVLVQAMTFEADAAGLSVAEAIAASGAAERRVLVDDYSRNVINDTMLPLPFRPRAVREEARQTLAMFDRLVERGVGVRITNPVLGNPLRYPLRNHKKLIVADDVIHVGGINFSDHNFAWHDLMLRIDDSAVANFLAGDFLNDWNGAPQPACATFGPLKLICADGVTNAAALDPLLAMIAGATQSVEMVSAYPTMPFVAAMTAAAAAGAKVAVYTPAPNNKPVVRDYLAAVAEPAGIALRLLPEMTHAKALLLDGTTLILGTSNFNFASYRTSNDIVIVVRDPALIADFERQLLAPMRLRSTPAAEARTPAWRKLRGRVALSLADAALARLRHGPIRVIDWPTGGR